MDPGSIFHSVKKWTQASIFHSGKSPPSPGKSPPLTAAKYGTEKGIITQSGCLQTKPFLLCKLQLKCVTYYPISIGNMMYLKAYTIHNKTQARLFLGRSLSNKARMAETPFCGGALFVLGIVFLAFLC